MGAPTRLQPARGRGQPDARRFIVSTTWSSPPAVRVEGEMGPPTGPYPIPKNGCRLFSRNLCRANSREERISQTALGSHVPLVRCPRTDLPVFDRPGLRGNDHEGLSLRSPPSRRLTCRLARESLFCSLLRG